LSDDGQFGLTVIAFIGSVFSPYYAWSGWRDPFNHCSVNVALYGPRGARWAMTERAGKAVERTAERLTIGPSQLEWSDEGLTIRIDEICAPIPRRVRGTIRLRPGPINGVVFPLDAEGRHSWRPIAPRAAVEVELERPNLRWVGEGYFDSNWGDEPLERAFRSWDWSRAHGARGTTVFYDVIQRDGEQAGLALNFGPDGAVQAVEAPPRVALPGTFWGAPRATRSETGRTPQIARTLEDAPFYNRSFLSGSRMGEPAAVIHESLCLDRFRNPLVRAMLPFRMPRVFW